MAGSPTGSSARSPNPKKNFRIGRPRGEPVVRQFVKTVTVLPDFPCHQFQSFAVSRPAPLRALLLPLNRGNRPPLPDLSPFLRRHPQIASPNTKSTVMRLPAGLPIPIFSPPTTHNTLPPPQLDGLSNKATPVLPTPTPTQTANLHHTRASILHAGVLPIGATVPDRSSS